MNSPSRTGTIRCSLSANLSVRPDGSLHLADGSVLVCPNDDTTIDTPHGVIVIPRGTLAFVTENGSFLRILCCSGASPVLWTSGSYHHDVQLSEELAVFNYRPTLSQILRPDGVGRRHLELIDLGNKHTAAVSEFSIPSLLKSNLYLGTWQHHSAMAKSVHAAILKAAAAIVVGKHPSAEKFYFAPLASQATVSQGQAN